MDISQSGLNPGFLVGGYINGLQTSASLGTGEYFIIEGDEYNSSCLDKTSKLIYYKPDCLIVNNIEFDHAEIFDSLDQIQSVFHYAVSNINPNGVLFASANDANVVSLINDCTVDCVSVFSDKGWNIVDLPIDNGHFGFTANYGNKSIKVCSQMLGYHNQKNITMALAVADYYNIPIDTIQKAILSFPKVAEE